ncbi:hypothetical protein HNQ91_002601 [Filimonas zeae]|uniref:DUF4136 domain-containing protein n=1 Tax=Filimonas zeae TaxID=1737353 RepID=A0A917ITE6_9BACT|nr:hypothetical protein [Filimonas zeae]MDR6339550.1 hypothetical protein [Filimonas zeae]GGH63098.1 hypothetical protein GCM10011379_13610 [Filimonas zeae]
MRNYILLLVVLLSGAVACKQAAPDKEDTREMYNARGLRVITSFANRKARTMSVLYGNEAARQTALNGYITHLPGGVFTLVVHKQHDNKYWYGSYLNGALLSVETVRNVAMPQQPAKLTYQLQQGQPPADSTGAVISAQKRMAYILSHTPSVFPGSIPLPSANTAE